MSKDGLLLLGWHKPHRERIYTMTSILGREVFTSEDVPQMTVTVHTTNFGTASVSIGDLFHRA